MSLLDSFFLNSVSSVNFSKWVLLNTYNIFTNKTGYTQGLEEN